jgi:peptidoglycan LD-endopeptidase CwlK
MSRALDDLSRPMRTLTFELLARLVERGIFVMIVDTLRTPQEQAANIAKGVSWTSNSKHLPRRVRGFASTYPDQDKSDAIDVCPYETYALHGPDKLQWDADDPAWKVIGEIGESLGLRWGGRWQRRDMGHLELPNP